MKYIHLLYITSIVTSVLFFNNNLNENYKKTTVIISQASDGEKLISKLDCVGCHKMDKKLIGPSYLDIAKKYPNNDKNQNYIADKIIKGGSGVWGSIPMAAHATLNKKDANTIAKYILSLKK